MDIDIEKPPVHFFHPSLDRSSSPLGGLLNPVRRASEFDVGRPPRYSTLIGTLPRLVPSNPIPFEDDGTPSPTPSFVPPAYTTVFQQRSQSLCDTRLSTIQRTQSLTPPTQFHLEHLLSPAQFHSENVFHKHEYHLMNGSKIEPWGTLKLSSSSSSGTPQFTEDDIIRGIFELNLDTPQNINSISLSLRGRITSKVYENGSYTFLDQLITSWDRSDGNPRSMFFTPETTIKKFEGKLSGQYAWPFLLTFPKEVTIRGQHQYLSKTYPTPRSFQEHGNNVSVEYELVLRMTHGILRADSKLNVDIVYTPDIITPDPFSLLREVAHHETSRLPGPDEDPDGWFTLPHANIHGKLAPNDQHAHLRCTLSLAKPQCYPRGSVIPCHLSVQSTNTEALNILANHESIRVCLVRRIHIYEDPKHAYTRTQQSMNAKADQVPPGVIEKAETIGRAVWWTSGTEEPDIRGMEGEIHLDEELQPSSQFLLFKVSYTVELYPFDSDVFKCTNSGFANTDTIVRKPKAFVSHPVTIATQHRQGQVAIPVTELIPCSQKRTEFPPPEFSFRNINKYYGYESPGIISVTH